MRAKLTIVSIQTSEDGASQTLNFSPDYGASPEDQTFSKYTPSASLTMTVTNPALIGQYWEGQSFYLDFTPIPKGQ